MADSFTVEWINSLYQFSHVDMDLVIVHDQGIIPEWRVSKNYALPFPNVTENFLEQEAINEIARLVADWNNANEPAP